MQNVAGIYLPDGETHLNAFLLDKATQVGGRGTYQLRKLRAALTYVKQRRVALDVGSHVGLWTMHLLREFQHVHCFEPVAEFRDCWKENVWPNVSDGIAHLWPFGLGDQDVAVTMVPEPCKPGERSTGGTHVGNIGVGNEQIRRLDGIAEGFMWPGIDFIKLDCEGFEAMVLRGAEKTIRKHKPCMVIEQKPGRAEKYGVNQFDAKKMLESWGAVERQAISGDHIFTWD